MHFILRRTCSYYLDVINRLFVPRNCFQFLSARVFSAQFTVISVKVRVYFNKFQKKFATRERFFTEYSSQRFLLAKVSALKVNNCRHLTLSPLSPGAPAAPVPPRSPYKKKSKT